MKHKSKRFRVWWSYYGVNGNEAGSVTVKAPSVRAAENKFIRANGIRTSINDYGFDIDSIDEASETAEF